jgi:hypothetical protein
MNAKEKKIAETKAIIADLENKRRFIDLSIESYKKVLSQLESKDK